MASKPSLTIIIPAFMEAKNIRGTVDNVLAAVNYVGITNYEIIIIDCLNKKGEDDGTSKIAEELAKTNPRLSAIHNPYVSLSYKYWQGVGLAKYEYITWIPGDNVILSESIKPIFAATGQADIISCYIANPEIRPLTRGINSKLFTVFVNLLFGLRLKYFNSVTVCRTDLLRSLPQTTKNNGGFSFNAEIIIRLIKSGHSYLEVPHEIRPDPPKIKAGGLKYLWSRYTPWNTIKLLLGLMWEIRFKKPSQTI